jgi:hypothetical protein
MTEPTRDQLAQDYAKGLTIINDLRRARDDLFAAANEFLREADTFHDDTAHYIEVRRSAVEALRAAVALDEARFWKPETGAKGRR